MLHAVLSYFDYDVSWGKSLSSVSSPILKMVSIGDGGGGGGSGGDDSRCNSSTGRSTLEPIMGSCIRAEMISPKSESFTSVP